VFVVCQAIGLEAVRSASEYSLLYSGNRDRLAESLEHIQRASTEIITAITAPG
jgi:hydrogenase maturation factor